MDQLGELSQVFRVLGFLGVLGCLAYFLTKVSEQSETSPKRRSGSGRRGIVLCSTLAALGNKQFLVVAEYDKDRKFLLGVSSGSVRTLGRKLSASGAGTEIPPSSR